MTDIRREKNPLLWSTFNMGNTKYPLICRRTKLLGRGVHSKKVREIGSR